MTAKRGMLEEAWNEFVVLHLGDVFLFQGSFPGPGPARHLSVGGTLFHVPVVQGHDDEDRSIGGSSRFQDTKEPRWCRRQLHFNKTWENRWVFIMSQVKRWFLGPSFSEGSPGSNEVSNSNLKATNERERQRQPNPERVWVWACTDRRTHGQPRSTRPRPRYQLSEWVVGCVLKWRSTWVRVCAHTLAFGWVSFCLQRTRRGRGFVSSSYRSPPEGLEDTRRGPRRKK